MDNLQNSFVILIYRDMSRYGGIESIAINLIKNCEENYIDAALICDTSNTIDEARDLLTFDVQTILKNNISQIIPKILTKENIKIIALGPWAGAFGVLFAHRLLREKLKSKINFAIGVFHPREFNLEHEANHQHMLNFLFARLVGNKYLYFMNTECKMTHERFLRSSFKNNIVLPIPVKYKKLEWRCQATSKRLKIVCIGRIVPFKAYNFSLPFIVNYLQKCGIDVQCDIYGHGSHEANLLVEIEKHNVNNYVKFKGLVPLEKFEETVIKYDLFLGMGLSAIQAAQLGVPTILAIDQEPEYCFGYFYQAPPGNVGENNISIPRYKIVDILFNFAKLDNYERNELSKKCAQATKIFSINTYITNIFNNKTSEVTSIGYIQYLYCNLYNKLSNENDKIRRFARFLKRIKTKKLIFWRGV